ncbi:hypothetical protein BC939DRAFT_454487 [Gamsiella multidivaricata]|uniref:uncharacterized protein n=1 Tax=Gamsiella multidivaricata TaxID=101098 RepID=UPI00221FBA43|nr:uncharacterized protein BC939DRAFT_454487 [Gamsiella multidivaricata]KAI7822011.1 hypothetical protein BC939DRAFT_454487 [Gamsiella multidivaricata]
MQKKKKQGSTSFLFLYSEATSTHSYRHHHVLHGYAAFFIYIFTPVLPSVVPFTLVSKLLSPWIANTESPKKQAMTIPADHPLSCAPSHVHFLLPVSLPFSHQSGKRGWPWTIAE